VDSNSSDGEAAGQDCPLFGGKQQVLLCIKECICKFLYFSSSFIELLKTLMRVLLSSFYDKEAMLMDPVDGPILASLLGTFSYCTYFQFI